MQIVIFTKGRTRQRTYERLPRSWDDRLVFCTTAEDAPSLPPGIPVLLQPDSVSHIGAARQWIVERWAGEPDDGVLMLDDDLYFYTRRSLSSYTTSTPAEVEAMLAAVEGALRQTVMVGVTPRLNAHDKADVQHNTRQLRAFAVRCRTLVTEDIRFDAVPVMEDFHVTLSLLERGYPNVLLGYWAQEQGGSGSAGGCSTYRTEALQAQAARWMTERHAPWVRLVERRTKAWATSGMGVRTDVAIRWNRAYAASAVRDRQPLP